MEIDSIVSFINHSKHPVQKDTVVQDRSETGLKMMTIITAIIDEGSLLKYVHFVETSMKQNDGTRQMTSSSTFYYNHHKLIKVEEYLMEEGQKKTADWYYENDQPLHYTVQSEKAAERAVQLLMISNGIKQQVIK